MTEASNLAEFLKARRAQLRPADVGLPDTGRRRTPGLRREEVATLAGVSVDYLIRLEQGRDRNPSASVVAALANALRLDDDERLHLKHLAAVSTTSELCPAAQAGSEVAPTVLTLLERLDPTPAFVVDLTYEVLAWNATWERVVAPLGFLDHRPPNLARYVFLQPAAQATYPDWECVAEEQVRQLRAAAPRLADDPRFAALLDELLAVPLFAERWAAYTVGTRHRLPKQLRHPSAGLVAFDVEVLSLEEPVGHRLVTWLPADDAANDLLRPPSPRLRVV